MLLALNVGNSNTAIGVYTIAQETVPSELTAHWRMTTPHDRTDDEVASQLQLFFTMRGLSISSISGIAISSVVPPVDAKLRRVCEEFLKIKPLFVEPGVKTGLPILTDNPSEVGADRVVNSVAAYDLFRGPAIVVDMGTATTFDVISAKGEFLGGAAAPGLRISADALLNRSARLPRVEIKKPAKIIGTGTTDNIQIGLYYGYIGLVDGILERLIAELGPETKTIATGGLAKLIAGGCKHIGQVD